MEDFKTFEKLLYKAVKQEDLAQIIELSTQSIHFSHIDGGKLLWLICEKRNAEILRILLNKLLRIRKFIGWLCKSDELDKLMFCIANMPPLKLKVLNDPLLVHICVDYNSVSVCEYLMAIGVDPNWARGVNQNTPLHNACLKSRLEIVKILCASPSCDINQLNSANFNALHFACKHDNLDVVKVLLANSIDVNIINTFDCTPLAVACDSGSAAIVRHLLSVRVELNLIVDNKNPFIQAYQQKYPQLFQN